MNSKDRSISSFTRLARRNQGALSAARSTVVFAAISALFAGVAVVSTAQVFNAWTAGPSVSVDPKILTWIREVKLAAVAHAETPISLIEEPIVISQSSPIAAPVLKLTPKAARKIVRRRIAKVSVPAARSTPPVARVAAGFSVVAAAAAVIPVTVIAPPLTTQDERTRLTSAYRSFRSQWLVSVNTHESLQAAVPAIELAYLVDPVPSARVPTIKRARPVKNPLIRSATIEPTIEDAALPVEVQPAIAAPTPLAPDLLDLRREAAQLATTRSLLLASALKTAMDGRAWAKVQPEPVIHARLAAPIRFLPPEPMATRIPTAPIAPPIRHLTSPDAIDPVDSPSVAIGAGGAATLGGATTFGLATTDSQTTQGQPVAPTKRIPDATPEENVSQSLTGATTVEAFDRSAEVANSRHRIFSAEGREGGEQSQWVESAASEHWPTLSFKEAGRVDSDQPVSLINNNTALLLAKLTGVQLQTQAGIIFGRIAKGWTVETSGRAERVVYLNDERQSVTAADSMRERNFAFINAAPGAHLLYAVAADGVTRAVAAIPVAEGSATHLDATAIQSREILGRILNGSSANAEGVAASVVRVVGQSGRSTTTAKDGAFRISDVRTIGRHAVYLESSGAGAFVHRYRLDQAALRTGGAIQLFRFGSTQVQNWVRQLEGGVSAESGIVVAAAPESIAARSPEPLFPAVRVITANAPLTPESYRLSADDALQVGVGLEPAAPRFISVQLPEGPSIVSLETRAEKSIISEVVYSSPGVVNVVGPY